MSDYEQRISINVDGLTRDDLDGKILTVNLSLEDIDDEGPEGPEAEAGPDWARNINVSWPRQASKQALADLFKAMSDASFARYPGRGGW